MADMLFEVDSDMYQACQKLILASASPRRRELLENIGIEIEVCSSHIDETPQGDEDPLLYGARMSGEKCASVMKRFSSDWVIAADTVVTMGGKILGKPASREEAIETLMLLGGREHLVATSFSLGNRQANLYHEETVTTRVRFAALSEKLAVAYVRTGESDDKAGAYGIQGIGGVFVKEICGSYSNVVGLPLCEVVMALSKYGIVKTK